LLQKHFAAHVMPAVRTSLSVFPETVSLKNEVRLAVGGPGGWRGFVVHSSLLNRFTV
jgi:hypothetical protein